MSGLCGFCRNQNGDDRVMTAACMKVLKVQRVTFGLGESRGVELRRTNLEFKNERRIRGNEDGVDPAAQTGNGEFEQDLPAAVCGRAISVGRRRSSWVAQARSC